MRLFETEKVSIFQRPLFFFQRAQDRFSFLGKKEVMQDKMREGFCRKKPSAEGVRMLEIRWIHPSGECHDA